MKIFLVQISPRGDGFAASVLRSPAGEDEERFELPFNAEALPLLLRRLDARVRHARPAPAADTDPVDPRRMGEELFGSLFRGRVLALYERSLGIVRGRGLRIQLKLNPRLPELARIQSLPWELLARAEDGGYLSLRTDSPIVRYLDVPIPVRPPILPLRLRILVAASQPEDLPLLDLAEERRRLESIRSIWNGRSRVDVFTLPRAGLASLRQALQESRCHVLHFMGHGALDPATGEGSLELSGADGGSETVRAEVLGSLLGEFKNLQLVVLNACLTATVLAPEESTDEAQAVSFQPFAGVAQALIRTGVPAVIAMQREITDPAAITFSEALYRRVAAGDPVHAAVTEGRKAIRDQDPESLEWSTPALFLRTPDGVLFHRWPALRLVVAWLVLILLLAVAGSRWFDKYDKQARHQAALEHYSRGVTLLDNELNEAARQEFRAALGLMPDSAAVHSNLAEVDARDGLYERAVGGYRRAIELDPDTALYHYNLGRVLGELGQPTAAIDSLQRATELDPTHLPTINELAEGHRGLGRLAEARRILEQALAQLEDELPPGSVAPLYRTLGRVELDDSEPAAAIQHLLRSRSEYDPREIDKRAKVTHLLAVANHRLGAKAEVCHRLRELSLYAPDLISAWDSDELPEALAAAHDCTLAPPDLRDPDATEE